MTLYLCRYRSILFFKDIFKCIRFYNFLQNNRVTKVISCLSKPVHEGAMAIRKKQVAPEKINYAFTLFLIQRQAWSIPLLHPRTACWF
jgi:hypothetical protein